MKVLTLDIETAPNLGYVWGLFKQSLSLNQLSESGYVLCVAYKWEHEREVRFANITLGEVDDIWKALDQADVVVTYNGDPFDLRWLNTEFAKVGLGEPSPYKSVDLLKTIRRRFRFPSNKLDYVAGALLGEHKMPTGGFDLWLGVLANDERAWLKMTRYCKRDVKITEKLYRYLRDLGWLVNPPNILLYNEQDDGCPRCGSRKYQRRGYAYTQISKYPRFQCSNGHWFRGSLRTDGSDKR